MAYTKYSLTPANNTAAPPDGAPEGMLPSAVNDTMRDMMAQIRDVGDGVRDGTYTMTAPKITGGTITGVTLTGNTLTNPVITGATLTTSAFNGTVGATTASTGAFTTLSTSSTTTLSGLTASTALALDASKNVVSVTNTGTGNNVLSASPTLTGTIAGASLSLSSLTSGRVTYAGASGLLSDSANLVFNGTNLGIGTGVTPNKDITIYKASTDAEIRLQAGTNDFYLSARNSGGQFDMFNASNAGITFGTNNLERMRITSAGLVGIGTSSPSSLLHLSSSGSTGQTITSVGTNVYSSVSFFNTTTGYGYDIGFGGSASVAPNSFYLYGGSTASVKLQVDPVGNLGLGVAPSAWASQQVALQNKGGALAAGATNELYLSQNLFYGGSPNADRYVNSTNASSFGQTLGAFTWRTAASGTAGNTVSFTQAMTLDASGNLLVGTTNTVIWNTTNTGVAIGGSSAPAIQISRSGDATLLLNRTSSDGDIAIFARQGLAVGGISVTTTLTSYNVTSDYRLKENIAPMTGALATVAQLKPVTYKWKVNGSDGQGFIAHELQAVVPDCVTGEKDAIDADGKPVYQQMDTSHLIATLVSAIQEQQALIESLTTRLTALESK